MTEIGPCIAHSPPEAVRLLKRGFAFVGWDVRTNRGVTRTPPTADKVYTFLTHAVEKVGRGGVNNGEVRFWLGSDFLVFQG